MQPATCTGVASLGFTKNERHPVDSVPETATGRSSGYAYRAGSGKVRGSLRFWAFLGTVSVASHFAGCGCLGASELSHQPLPQRRAQYPDQEQASEEHNCIKTGSAFTRPIHIVQVEPERELVEGQRRSGAIEQAHEAA